jgi:hypothetical protein
MSLKLKGFQTCRVAVGRVAGLDPDAAIGTDRGCLELKVVGAMLPRGIGFGMAESDCR